MYCFGSTSIASFATVFGAPIGIVSVSLAFSISTGIIKKLLKTTRNQKKKRNKIAILARSKLNSIESKISGALTNNETKHENIQQLLMKKKNTEN